MCTAIDAKTLKQIINELRNGILPILEEAYKVDSGIRATGKTIQFDFRPREGCLLFQLRDDRWKLRNDLKWLVYTCLVGKYPVSFRFAEKIEVGSCYLRFKVSLSGNYFTDRTDCADAALFFEQKTTFLLEAPKLGLDPSLFGKTLRPSGARGKDDYRLLGFSHEPSRKYVFLIRNTVTHSKARVSLNYIENSKVIDD